MNSTMKRTATPLHMVILHMAALGDLRTTLDCIGEHAGYPHTISVLDISGDPSSAHYLHALRQAEIVQNLTTPAAPGAPAVALMRLLAAVDAPYALVLSSGTVFSQAGWLRRILGLMLASKAPALATGPADDVEYALTAIVNPNELSGHLCQPGHTILATQSALERLGVFTHRGILQESALPHSADIAARETRLATLHSLH